MRSGYLYAAKSLWHNHVDHHRPGLHNGHDTPDDLPVDVALHFLVRQSQRLQLLLGDVGRDSNGGALAAVNLYGHLDLVVLALLGIVGWPFEVDDGPLCYMLCRIKAADKLLPEMRGERRQEQYQRADVIRVQVLLLRYRV